ncbi:MAG: alpha-ketoacid dehydrogenase subunit beta [Acholeplasmatales bacterium]|jgi:pyruvate dehydrogenase E1 component beta subunit|nr:alpha-ketoacid dehydrogenase subunit beta [Acholeplasmataceae bacterium]MDY0114924.1 alpha-ketoacid dehydrogenase subunit beta [Acholeplasmatales bacterium]MCK9233816.1 alpha-ketoacid dehydrogenase subunit beta [Acholeplasmataceae bacterium]MCK9289511.1 alpha-ketoacid dehydrogenase subunit beta [Acholeplasmataceae bacterium]MCK9427135.1 alpha-ketoacid dehydrogenase subunit beta [Acholeplasmataceae bacterium]
MAAITLLQAINQALDQAMANDERVVVYGEDTGFEGGVFRVTAGLQKKYGEARVFDTPISESTIAGAAIGMAINGLLPVAEIQFDGFIFPALTDLVTHAARFRNRSRGQYSVPMVLRVPHGGGIRALEHHSESIEMFVASVPGLKVVTPSTPYDAKGLLLAAINDPDPVIYLEPKKIYRAGRQEVPEESYQIPLGKAKVVKPGTDITVVSWGALVRMVEKAALEVAKEGISVEVIDLRTLVPYDKETLIQSVKKTGKFMVVTEAVKSYGPASELIAMINEEAFYHLEAAPVRFTGFDITVPLARGEHYHYPSEEKIISYLRKLYLAKP